MNKNINKVIKSSFGAFLMLFIVTMPINIYANISYEIVNSVNVNDYSSNMWDRFTYNYQFSSDADYRYELGKSTTYEGNVPVDVYSANIRRDKNVSLYPPGYGVFSGNIAAQPTNYLFKQPINTGYSNAFELMNTNVLSQ